MSIEDATIRQGYGFVGVFAVLAAGCASQQEPVQPPPQPLPTMRAALSEQTQQSFEAALATMAAVDKANGWNKTRCRELTTSFAQAAGRLEADAAVIDAQQSHTSQSPHGDRRDKLVIAKRRGARYAHYNEALVLSRCGSAARARALLEPLLRDQPDFHQARVLLAQDLARDDRAFPRVVEELERAVKDAAYANADALVLLATVQLRWANQTGADKPRLLDASRANLQRALAVDDDNLPAYNQLAQNYLERARLRRLQSGRHDDATLEMASLICAQAQKRRADFAPIHNTAGVIFAERGDPGAAARAFASARRLDPKLFEAHMNYAAVNLQFRGFANARSAYEAALALKPKSYDAMVGLALALRGTAGGNEQDPLIDRARKLLHNARRLDETRPESYLNEAILIVEYEARYLEGKKAQQALDRARTLLTAFMQRSEKQPRYASARIRAQGRLDDIDQMSRLGP